MTLNVQSISKENCLLFMWTTAPHMENAIKLGNAWGFAGIAGPIMITLGKQYIGSYELILYVFCGLFVLNLIIAYILKENSKVT